MTKYICFKIFFISVILFLTDLFSFAETLEHSFIKPIPKSVLKESSEHRDYTYEFPFYDTKTNMVTYIKIEGTLWKLSYHIFGKDNQRKDGVYTSVEIIRTYRDFALKEGGEILWERGKGGRLTFTIPTHEGGRTWCQVSARDGYYELDIVEEDISKNTFDPKPVK